MVASRGEVGAACSAVVDNELVVDLWGGYADPKTKRAWESDTIVNVFSTTEGMSSMAVLHAASCGLFGFDDLVADGRARSVSYSADDIEVIQLKFCEELTKFDARTWPDAVVEACLVNPP